MTLHPNQGMNNDIGFLWKRRSTLRPESRPGVAPGQRRPTACDRLVVFANLVPQTRWGRRDACPTFAALPPVVLRLKCLVVAVACSLPFLLVVGRGGEALCALRASAGFHRACGRGTDRRARRGQCDFGASFDDVERGVMRCNRL